MNLTHDTRRPPQDDRPCLCLSDCVDSRAVPVDFEFDFELPKFWKLVAGGPSYARVKVGVLLPVLEVLEILLFCIVEGVSPRGL